MGYNVLDRIREQYDGMSKGHKKIAAFILEHYDQAVFMTAARLGDTLRISESTVVRFASGIGYAGYPDIYCESGFDYAFDDGGIPFPN